MMKVKRTIKMEVEQFEVGDVIKFKLKDGEKVEAMAMQLVFQSKIGGWFYENFIRNAYWNGR